MALRLSTGLRTELMGDGSGDSLKALLANGVMELRTGSQPATADLAETGTLLVRITESSGAFTGGVATNGLEFDAAVAGVLSKAAAETWSGLGLAIGVIGWFRYHGNAYTLGESATAVRFDGTVATAGSQLVLSSTSVVVDIPISITTFSITQPATP